MKKTIENPFLCCRSKSIQDLKESMDSGKDYDV